jgi:hypothetical protein
MLSAMLIGGLLARMLDFVVFVPAILVGASVVSWRGLAISYLITLGIVLAIKVPTIRETAERLQIPDASLTEITLWYAAAVGIWVLLIILMRRIFSGNWPIKRPNL